MLPLPKVITKIAIFASLFLMAACATAPSPRQASPNPHYKVGTPYVVAGKRYFPREDPSYRETGIASWYGPNFHGKLTANGELFDMERLTAAHKTLPLPSLARVTNLENGRSTLVRINDRGPFAGDRIIDLSKAAAERLGTKDKGLAQVEVTYLGRASLDDAIVALGQRENIALMVPPESTAVPSPPRLVSTPPQVQAIRVSQPAAPVTPIPAVLEKGEGKEAYYVQLGTFSHIDGAVEALSHFHPAIPRSIRHVEFGQTKHHQARLGPYTYEFAAREAQRVALDEGFSDAFVVRRRAAE